MNADVIAAAVGLVAGLLLFAVVGWLVGVRDGYARGRDEMTSRYYDP